MEAEEGRVFSAHAPSAGGSSSWWWSRSQGNVPDSGPEPIGAQSRPLQRSSSTAELQEASPLTSMKDNMLFPPEESVYSYLMFMAPIEQRRAGRFMTPLIFFAFVLVIVNFIMQVGLLYVVGQHIMRKHTEWVGSVAKIKHHAWYHVFPMPYNIPEGKCRTNDGPLCSNHGDGISCSPRSVQVLADWHLLDTNKDGTWSRKEAEDKALRKRVQCEFNVDLLDLYKHTLQSLHSSSGLIGRHDTNLTAGVAVHQAYLNWYLHKPLLCTYGDQDICGALFERGIFDEALRQQSSIDFKDTASALKYCNNLLQYECFDILPSTYSVWRFVSNQQCGAKVYGQSDYVSPAEDGEFAPMLSVDFRKRKEYEVTKTPGFRVFLCILLVTFLSVMALEMKSILRSFIWCGKFPADRGVEGRIVGSMSVQISKFSYGADEDEESVKKSILAVRWDHRCLVFTMTLLRLMLWCFLMWSGIMFLTGPPRYLTLIFDALSLVFIFEIDELLYKTMLRHEFKNDHMSVEDMLVPQWHGGAFTGNMSVLTDIAWFLGVIALGIVIVFTYCHTELNPLLDSLECLCAVQGSKCYGAQHYTKQWWDSYWSTTLPASDMIINQLKSM